MGQLLDHSTNTLSYHSPQRTLDDSLCYESLSRLETACFFWLPMLARPYGLPGRYKKTFSVGVDADYSVRFMNFAFSGRNERE
jgi:hypothetical protein